ncbi:MAG: aminoglycoside phosphotransferase family protein [Clostridia bacterium]|nr:aminoglycoside phosphotransferase family protein [Clostridia bacterium]
MESYTKTNISKYDAKKIFDESGVGIADNIKEVEAGEFNTIFQIKSGNDRYFIKFGSSPEVKVLSYEKDILNTEIGFYKKLEGTAVKRPNLLFSDTTRTKVPVDYFIMDALNVPLLGYTFPSTKQRKRFSYQLGANLAELHKIKGEGFGYPQCGLESTWKDAYKKMVNNIIADATVLDVKLDTYRINNVLERADKYLEEVTEPSLVHFDVWVGNIFVSKTHNFQGLIDWERAMWGDPVGDFISLNLFHNFARNEYLIKGYNSVTPFEITESVMIRADLLRMYLGLIMSVEPCTRWRKGSLLYIGRRLIGKRLFNKAVNSLEKAFKE